MMVPKTILSFLSEKSSLFLLGLILFIDFLGFNTLQAQLLEAHPFYYQRKMGLVDTLGNVILEPQLDRIFLFRNRNIRYTKYRDGGVEGLIGLDGTIVSDIGNKKAEIEGDFMYYYDDPANLMGLHVLLMPEQKEIMYTDSLRFADPTSTKAPFFTAVNHKKMQPHLVDAKGNVLGKGENYEVWLIDYEHETCPLFSIGTDPIEYPNFEKRRRLFSCKGAVTSKEEYAKEMGISIEQLTPPAYRQNRSSKKKRRSNPNLQESRKYNEFPEVLEFGNNQKEYSIHSILHVNKKVLGLIALQFSNRKFGVINLEGEVLVPAEYESVEKEGNYLEVRKGGQRGIVTLDGTMVLPMKFLNIEAGLEEGPDMPYTFTVTTFNGYRGWADKAGNVFLPKAALED